MLRTILSFVFFTCVLFQSCGPDIGTVTKEEAAAAGVKLESMIKSGNSEAVAMFFDMPSLYKIFKEKSSNANEPSIKKELNNPLALVAYTQQMVAIAKTGSYQLLRSYEKDGRQRLLFRALEDGGVNYQDFQLTKVNNVVKVDDVINYMTGETITATLAATADALMGAAKDKNNVSSRFTDTVLLINKLGKEGDYFQLKEMYERLPTDLQRARGIMTLYVNACRYVSDEAYEMALNKAMELDPESPGAYLCMIELGTQREQYDKVLFALNKIDTITGGDPFLDHYRGGAYWFMGKPAEAKICLEKVLAYDPGFVVNIKALLRLYIKDNENDKAEKALAAYKKSKGFTKRDMDTLKEEFPQLFK